MSLNIALDKFGPIVIWNIARIGQLICSFGRKISLTREV